LGQWYTNVHYQCNWEFTKYNDDIIHTTYNSIEYFQCDDNQHYYYKTYTKQPDQHAIVQSEITHPLIPIYIGNDIIRCGVQTSITHTHTPIPNTPYDHIPITINIVSPTYFGTNEIIEIASDGGLSRGHSTFGIVISINNKIATELYGTLPNQLYATSLTSEAYGCYYAINKIRQQLGSFNKYHTITILLDNKSLISRIKSLLKYRPFPTACLKSKHEVISAIANIIDSLPNVHIKHVSSKNQINRNTEEQILHSLSHHLSQDARQDTPIPNIIIPHLHLSSIDLILINQKVSSNYLEELRYATAKPALWQFYKEKYN
jgi:hypothetical protein